MTEARLYDTHSRLFAIPSPPSEVATAIVLIIDDALAVSAAITGARGNAFRHEIVTSVFHEVFVTDAMIRCDAVAVLATVLADWLAGASVSRLEAVVARAMIRLCACAVSAALCAKRHAMAVLTFRVIVLADANIGCNAYTISPAGKVTNWFTDVRHAVVERGELLARLDPRWAISFGAGTYVWRGAFAINTFEVANWLADGVKLFRRIVDYLIVHRRISEPF